MQSLELTRPDDLHVHLRDGPALAAVAGETARQFARAIVMPNLKPPVTTTAAAAAYRARILASLPADSGFEPLMTLYLTDNTPASEIRAARASGFVHAVKLYPQGATTNSDAGVSCLERTHGALEAMAEVGMPLLVHGEVTDPDIDVFDREAVFLDEVLAPLLQRLPGLRVVLEHVTSRAGVQFVQAGPDGVAASITPHHLLLNRNAMFEGGLRPDHYCLPVMKREQDRRALLQAATAGTPKFFLGTDSAPHGRAAKLAACGCAGIYNAHCALELYAEAFEEAGALERLDDFASRWGAQFYGLPRNTGRVRLVREQWRAPESLAFGDERLVPMRAGQTLRWKMR
ncbi:MAG: dihydroorotase [Gammaproteobacteria bacterium]